jgi:ABC-type antimicrobial peptide transport system permease subunit
MILKQNLTLCVIGMLAGVLGTWIILPWTRRALPETSQIEPATFILAVAVLVAMGVIACWLPARRAARVDPMEALRNE